MNTNLKIYTLSGCSTCQNFKQLLLANNITFKEIVCSNSHNGDICDSLEHMTDCEMYPMIHVENSIICITEEYNLVGRIKLERGNKIIYCHSINTMFDILKKILYLK